MENQARQNRGNTCRAGRAMKNKRGLITAARKLAAACRLAVMFLPSGQTSHIHAALDYYESISKKKKGSAR
jgi:hypothetical protein